MTSRESTDSNAVEADGIRMEIIVPDLVVLTIPENKPGANAPVKLSVSITNNTPTPFNFSFYGTWIPELVAPDGQVLQRHLITNEQVSQEQLNSPSRPGWRVRLARVISNLTRQHEVSDCPEDFGYLLVAPRETIVISLNAKLCRLNNLLRLEWTTTDLDFYRPNEYWYFEALEPGTYQLRFIYLSPSESRLGSDLDRMEVRSVQETGSSQLATPFVNLRLVQPIESDSSAVEVDGIRFETLVPERVLRLPVKKRGVETYVQLGICITNNTLTPLRFSFYASLRAEIVASDGQIIRGGYRSLGVLKPKESDFPLAMPGESVTFFPDAKLFWLERNLFTLSIAAGDGGFWGFEALNPGTYWVRFTHNNKNAVATIYGRERTDTKLIEGLWMGMVSTPFVEFRLVQP